MQIGQRIGIIEPRHFRHETFDQVQHPVGAIDKTFQQFPRLDAGAFAALVKPAFHSRGFFGGRQPDESKEIAALVKQPGFFKLLPALHVQQGRSAVGKQACRIFGCRISLCFNKDRPAGAEAAKRAVEPCGGADQFGRRGAVEIGTAKPGRALE